jgi:hypothetical protein
MHTFGHASKIDQRLLARLTPLRATNQNLLSYHLCELLARHSGVLWDKFALRSPMA